MNVSITRLLIRIAAALGGSAALGLGLFLIILGVGLGLLVSRAGGRRATSGPV